MRKVCRQKLVKQNILAGILKSSGNSQGKEVVPCAKMGTEKPIRVKENLSN